MLLRIFIVIIIIIGGVIIIIGGKPFPPEPECLVCGGNFIKFLGIILVALGAASFAQLGKLGGGGLQNQGKF